MSVLEFDLLKALGLEVDSFEYSNGLKVPHFFESFREPIYFTKVNRTLIFSQSIKELLDLRKKSGYKRIFDTEAVQSYWNSGFVVAPYTIWNELYKLPIYTMVNNRPGELCLTLTGPDLANVEPFPDEKACLWMLKNILDRSLANDDEVVVTFSGGIDSTVMADLVGGSRKKSEFLLSHYKMPGFEGEARKARHIAKKMGTPLIEISAKTASMVPYVKKFLSAQYEPIYDPVAPITNFIVENAQSYFNGKNRKILLVEGQGADSIMFGLPHNRAISLHFKVLTPLFWILRCLIPTTILSCPPRNRNLKKIVTLIKIYAEYNWADAILISLNVRKRESPKLYEFMKYILLKAENALLCRQKAISLLFIYVLQSRESQKYRMLPENVKVILPFMNNEFIARSLSSPTSIFSGLFSFKKPVTSHAKYLFPTMFKRAYTTPFIVNYTLESDRVIQEINGHSYAHLKQYCIDELLRKCDTL